MKYQRPEVYVDMDGVLADFFAEYAKLAGVKSGNYRDIPAAKTDPTLQKMQGTDFFARLPKFPSADQLIKMVTKIYGRYHICSSPLRGDHEGSEHYKNVWIKEHLNPRPATVIITPNKAKYAVQADGTPNILIDDRGSNITAWEAKGGIGIKYQADEDGLDVIVNGLARARKIMNGELEHNPQKLTTLDRSTGKTVAKSGHNDAHNDEVAENDEIRDPRQMAPIMAKESASVGATSTSNGSSLSAQGGGWLFGGTVGAPKNKKKKSKVLRR
jgi:5'-nucleotidase